MIQEYYGLNSEAFSLSPDLGFLFVSNAHEEALAHLAYGLEQNEDITLIVGDIGTGKTLAVHQLLAQVSKSFIPVYISVTQLNFEQLLQLVMLKLGVPVASDAGLAGLLYAFEQQLIIYRDKGQRVLLLIDEAQNLPVESLESVRMLMNLAQPGKPALQLVLVGQLDLQHHLNLPEMRQLQQRIRVKYQLGFLSRKEMESYLVHRLEVAGRTKKLFKKSALDKIFQFSGGVPRLVNHLATKALLNGYVAESGMISGQHVEELDINTLQESPRVDIPEKAAVVALEEPSQPSTHAPEEPVSVDDSSTSKNKLIPVFFLVVILILAGFFTKSFWSPFWTELTASQPAEVSVVETEEVVQKEAPVATPVEAPAEAANPVVVTSEEEPAEIESVESAIVEEQPTIPVTLPVDSKFIGHVASFREEAKADEFWKMVGQPDIPVFVRMVEVEEGKQWYRVYFGPFDSEEVAKSSCDDLKTRGIIQYYLILEDS